MATWRTLATTLLLTWLCAGATASEQEPKPAPAAQAKPDDGWWDVSGFLKEKYGFLPLAIPITEPAIGYGAAGALAFISKPLGETKAGFGRPDVTIVGGMATENDSSAFAFADIRYWLDDHLQTRVFAIDGSLNLDFYGIGDNPALSQQPLRYNMDPTGTSLEARYRLGDTPWWVGCNYSLANIDVSFGGAGAPVGLTGTDEIEVGGLTPSLTFDSRDNMFTPSTGSYVEATLGLFDDALGGDTDFQRAYLLAMHYEPVAPDLWFGVRGDAAAAFGDVPFFLDPFVTLRGVPMLRYQGEAVASVEAELRWQFWGRISLVGFGGVGATWNDPDRFDNTSTVTAGGFGLRYELAREFGLHAGFDIAWGPEETVLYIQVGSAWARP